MNDKESIGKLEHLSGTRRYHHTLHIECGLEERTDGESWGRLGWLGKGPGRLGVSLALHLEAAARLGKAGGGGRHGRRWRRFRTEVDGLLQRTAARLMDRGGTTD
uniref:Uncharacterized protein n=1 Tax=Oryza punctata TaxID=4537 RepID=A0A0E0LHX0_ORYPU